MLPILKSYLNKWINNMKKMFPNDQKVCILWEALSNIGAEHVVSCLM